MTAVPVSDSSTVKRDGLSVERDRADRDQCLLFKAMLVVAALLLLAAVVAAVSGWQPEVAGHAVAGPEMHAAAVSAGVQRPGTVDVAVAPVVSPDDAPAVCSVSGSGQCGPGVAGGPVLSGGRWVCADPAATLLTNGAGVLVCDYHVISTAAFVVPQHDAAGEPWCAAGSQLYDTEQPGVGDEGVVCTETWTQA